MGDSLETYVASALQRQKNAVSKLITLFEKTDQRSLEKRIQVLHKLKDQKRGTTIGWTGSPGVGKSTLLATLLDKLPELHSDVAIAIVAIDPSSSFSGGSLLGDRTRVRIPYAVKNLFFRSQAAGQRLGGIANQTFSVVQLLELLFDYVFVETVGVGQNEIEICRLSNSVFYLLQPDSGDQIQFLKAGVMEIPHAFIVNKADKEQDAKRCFYQLSSTLDFLQQFTTKERPDIIMASSISLHGVSEIITLITEQAQSTTAFSEQRRSFYFRDFILSKAGSAGLNGLKGSEMTFQADDSYEQGILSASVLLRQKFNLEIL